MAVIIDARLKVHTVLFVDAPEIKRAWLHRVAFEFSRLPIAASFAVEP
jgi:hypothetical protein